MNKEYIIWGKPPHSDDETLLVSETAGIASMEQAQRVIAQLTDIHGCRDCRVQVFTLGNGADVINAFKGTIA
jgi:hypothetical protein